MITFAVKEDRQEAFLGVLTSVKQDLPLVDGCQAVRILAHSDVDSRFTLIEEWDSRKQHAAHIDGLALSGAWAAIEDLLAAPPNGRWVADFEPSIPH